MVKKDRPIGLTVRETKLRLDELIAEKRKIEIEMAPLAPKSIIDGMPIRYVELSHKLESVNEQIIQVREWYNVGLTELLHDESKRMNNLTIILIVLTVIFGVLTALDVLSRLVHT